jgi:AraC family transcriptional regulator of adaptative response/methylated-DNA-[protein]-cysteine methyltransferase
VTPRRDYDRIERAIRFLDAERRRRPSLAETAAHVGLSPFHFQRLFKRWAGVSPKQLLQYLGAAQTVLDAAFATGLSSPGRLHDLLVTVDAVTPGELRTGGAGLTLRHGLHETPYGVAHVALSERGIVSLAFCDEAAPAPEATLRRRWPAARLQRDAVGTRAVIERVFADLAGASPPLPLLLRGTNWQVRVWEALLRIPEGAVVSYGGLANALGRPAAARAVAGAVAANPIAYLVPCHRVLRATGAIGGYRWGTARKRALLARERARAGPGTISSIRGTPHGR